MSLEERWDRVGQLMEINQVDALVVMRPENLFYLTGDGRPCAIAVMPRGGEPVLFVPVSDVADVESRVTIMDVRPFRDEVEMLHGTRDAVAEGKAVKVGVERAFLSASMFHLFETHLFPSPFVLVDATPILSEARLIKKLDEIQLMMTAAEVADAGMAAAKGAIREGVAELEVAAEAEYAMRKRGAERWAIPTYVASGKRSAVAHGRASTKRLAAGELVQVDLAPVVSEYCADICRTFTVGAPGPEAQRAHQAYLQAQARAIAAARAGQPVAGIEEALGKGLAEAGYPERFLRPTLHGVGLQHEELPIPPGHAVVHGERAIETLGEGMVVAIGNCGLYLEEFGVRIEDTVWVSPRGPQELTKHSKSLT